MSSGDHGQQERDDHQERPRKLWVKGFPGSTVRPIPAQPTESAATRIGWVGTSWRASDATCRAIHID